MLRFGYNTNGFAHHRLEDAIEIIAQLGYQGIAITVDVHHLNPEQAGIQKLRQIRKLLEENHLEPAIETGARYLLDPTKKHHPTLLDPDPDARQLRLGFLEDCVTMASELGAKVVSFWSGRLPAGVSEQEGVSRLESAFEILLKIAEPNGVKLALEPEPGMFIENISQFRDLRSRIGSELKLALDIGHCYCTNDLPITKVVDEFKQCIATAAIEDIRGGKHEHLMFGEGEIQFADALRPWKEINYQGLINVELSRDSHRAPEVAEKSIRFLREVERDLD